MKFLLAIALAAGCAAPQTNHVNVAVVRDGISDVIQHDSSNPRTIVSMGHTTNNTATVYTKSADGNQREESWVHSAQGWTLATGGNNAMR
ncbi:MAG TPA: hypothetical protein VGG28_09535 [Kofleriaceae bacterium]|jgi:hypothetical protein